MKVRTNHKLRYNRLPENVDESPSGMSDAANNRKKSELSTA